MRGCTSTRPNAVVERGTLVKILQSNEHGYRGVEFRAVTSSNEKLEFVSVAQKNFATSRTICATAVMLSIVVATV